MRLVMRGSLTLLVLACIAQASTVFAQQRPAAPAQDSSILRYAERLLPWYPGSAFRIVGDERRQTPSGSYRMVTVERDCASEYLKGKTSLVVDEVSGLVWWGAIGKLPGNEAGFKLSQLRPFVEDFLPKAIASNMGMQSRVEWDGGTSRAGALIPFELRISTGYGEYARPCAVTSDGAQVVLGPSLPLDRDPVAVRRELLRTSPFVVWDRGDANAALEIVEFSDFQCPGCRMKWPLIKKLVEEHGAATRHGLVSFPLTTIHPWAFRAASASWCVGAGSPELVVELKELFYSLQEQMEVGEVTSTALDFVSGSGLGEAEFRACYLRPPSLDAVHGQLNLGHRVNISATPTYVFNGWLVQVPDEQWLAPMVKRLLAGEEP